MEHGVRPKRSRAGPGMQRTRVRPPPLPPPCPLPTLLRAPVRPCHAGSLILTGVCDFIASWIVLAAHDSQFDLCGCRFVGGALPGRRGTPAGLPGKAPHARALHFPKMPPQSLGFAAHLAPLPPPSCPPLLLPCLPPGSATTCTRSGSTATPSKSTSWWRAWSSWSCPWCAGPVYMQARLPAHAG